MYVEDKNKFDLGTTKVELLLLRGSTFLNLPDISGWTQLYDAAYNEHDSTAKILKAASGVDLVWVGTATLPR